ncbi:helix-turn-helix transcriptional regulator [Amycolatopsis orientalis]|uniref:helix-turn-helix transcriptional regulator n=1 Tax=Amycolatopsis orientalis TaxID=31958 RepID=UPI00055FEC9B|nr:helix-turn-helix domain-containing protein [Amycolatopsis orientalis]
MSRTRNSKRAEWLTIAEVLDELGGGLARSTFNDWRAKKVAPRCIKLPNNQIRIRRSDFESWLESRTEEAA